MRNGWTIHLIIEQQRHVLIIQAYSDDTQICPWLTKVNNLSTAVSLLISLSLSLSESRPNFLTSISISLVLYLPSKHTHTNTSTQTHARRVWQIHVSPTQCSSDCPCWADPGQGNAALNERRLSLLALPGSLFCRSRGKSGRMLLVFPQGNRVVIHMWAPPYHGHGEISSCCALCCSYRNRNLYIVEYWAFLQHKDAIHTRQVVSDPRSMLHTIIHCGNLLLKPTVIRHGKQWANIFPMIFQHNVPAFSSLCFLKGENIESHMKYN